MTTKVSNMIEIRGWVFYDAECRFCVRGRERFGPLFERRGFRWMPLQTPGTAARLGFTDAELMGEMKLLLPDGRVLGGVEAWTKMFRSVWWLWLVGALLGVPVLHWIGAKVYAWIARNRHCLGGRCTLPPPGVSHHRHSAFLELP